MWEMLLHSFLPASHNTVVIQIYVVQTTGGLVGCLAEKQEACLKTESSDS